MIAWRTLRRGDGWLVAALVVSVAGVCWQPAWWTIATFAVVAVVILLGWQSATRECELAHEENRRLVARIHEFGTLQGRFVGNIAHEIKTPLSVVLGETDLLLLRCQDPAAVRGLAGSMAAEVRHLSDLVESFLQLAHPLVHEDTANHVPVFVGDLVIAAVARCRDLSKSLGVRIVTVLGEPDNGDPSAEVMGDPLLLEIMVENLLRNALRFSPPDSQVDLTTRADADSVGITVRDRGIGIPPEQQVSVFDWFFEGPGRPSKTMGTGFGLAIAKRVVDHHGGTIILRDAPGSGCEFAIKLPRWWPAGGPSAQPHAEHLREPPVAPTA